MREKRICTYFIKYDLIKEKFCRADIQREGISSPPVVDSSHEGFKNK